MEDLTMKRLTLAFLMVMALALSAFAGDGEWTTNGIKYRAGVDQYHYFYCTVDSIDTLTSNPWMIDGYNADLSDSPIAVGWQATSTLGAPKLTVYVYGSMDNSNWLLVDSLCSASTSEAVQFATLDMDDKYFRYYRYVIYGITENSPDTVLKLFNYYYQKD
jgi:hypothetical protein